MKTKLIELGLPEKLIDEILEVFKTYQQTLKLYDKPKGVISFRDHVDEIQALSGKLKKRLDRLSNFELQMLNHNTFPDIFQLKTSLIRLDIACNEAKKRKTRFSKKRPFLLMFAKDLKILLESHDIAVNLYRKNLFCQIFNILFNETINETGDNETAFNILRQILS
jgi:hypothetical protein